MAFKKFARRHAKILSIIAALENILRREYACQPLMIYVEMLLLVSHCGWVFMWKVGVQCCRSPASICALSGELFTAAYILCIYVNIFIF